MLIMIKRVFSSYHSVEKNVKSISKGLFLVIFCIFQFCYELSIECQILIIFRYFDIGVFDKNLYYNVVIFQYLTFC